MDALKRGDIVYVEKYYTTGSEQHSGRPAIIVSNNKNNLHSGTIEIVYLTTAPKHDLPTHVTIRSAPKESIALCEQLTTVNVSRISGQICAATDREMAQIDTALLISLDLYLDNTADLGEVTPPPTANSRDSGSVHDTDDRNIEIAGLKAELAVYKRLYADLLDRVSGVGRAAS